LSDKEKISVIIPSLADGARAKLLDRAIESVLSQQEVNAVPIVVVNGNRSDPAVLASMNRRASVRCIDFSGHSLPEARLRGRELVDTPFFAYLDDDDELLPNSIATRLLPMLADEQIDAVVSNGFRDSPSGREITDPNIIRFQSDPLDGLMEVCWLNANGGLFRTKSIGREFFVDLPPVVEWTHIAFKLSQSRNILFLNEPTFVQHVTPRSLYSSREFLVRHPYVLRDMLGWKMPRNIRNKLKQKYIAALHQTSELLCEMGDLRSAWRYHLKSLCHLRGQRYLGYTRHLLRRQLAELGRARTD